MQNRFFVNSPAHRLPVNLTTAILQNENALPFHMALPGYRPTSLHHLPHLAGSIGLGDIYIKDESERFSLNAFKVLGASFAIHKLLQKNATIKVFCTATDGNHGRAVAWAAKQAKKQAVVFVPKGTTAARITAIEKEGAELFVVDGNYDETCARAAAMAKKYGWELVQDTAWENYEEVPAYIMAGYLTHFKELENSLHQQAAPSTDIVFLQCGVGSWAAAAAWYYCNRYGYARPKLVVVEPVQSAGMLASFQKGERAQPTGNLETIMAGLNCGIPSSSAWAIIKMNADLVITIDDQTAINAMKTLYYPQGGDPQVIAGESGVAGLAACLAIQNDREFEELSAILKMDKHTRCLFYNTEGATDAALFKKLVQGS
jgi:diaminopropionate ammonia-lyase